MGTRLELHAVLLALMEDSPHVYFQPPESMKLSYPCIIYHKDRISTIFANNSAYLFKVRYKIMYVDESPDSLLPLAILKLPMCTFDRTYKTSNLNHDVFTIYF